MQTQSVKCPDTRIWYYGTFNRNGFSFLSKWNFVKLHITDIRKAGSCQERSLTVVMLAIFTLHEKKWGVLYPVMSHTQAYSLNQII